jgi:hypothetical protein
MCPVLDEVIGPDVIAVLRPQTNAGSVRQPEAPSFWLLLWNLQPLTPPDPLDPLVVDEPARVSQQSRDLPVAIATILTGKRDDVGGQTLLVLTTARDLALRRAMLTERRTGATLGDVQLTPDMLDTDTATCGAQKFPLAAS